jgi:hypothetical protein
VPEEAVEIEELGFENRQAGYDLLDFVGWSRYTYGSRCEEEPSSCQTLREEWFEGFALSAIAVGVDDGDEFYVAKASHLANIRVCSLSHLFPRILSLSLPCFALYPFLACFQFDDRVVDLPIPHCLTVLVTDRWLDASLYT